MSEQWGAGRDDDIPIRALTERDIDAVGALCLASFMQAVATSLPPQGIATFRQLVSPAAFLGRMQGDNVLLMSATAEGTPRGMIELKNGRHVAMFFVAPGQQRQGLGRQLLRAALHHARAEVVTVSASLPSVPAYLRFGFDYAGEVAESAGLIYQPMALARERTSPFPSPTALPP